MNKPLISVIVPIYKVEDYLERCIQSIVNQTYRNLEIILVDDGSPDQCGTMCDSWREKDSRIKVIHKKNGGLSDARNAGMEVATGELMGFVDSDDWIEPYMYELLYQHMQQDNSDIAACGVEMVWEDGAPSRMLTASGSYILSRDEAMRALMEESLLKQPVWYKLYKTPLVQNIPFPVGKCHEDVFWSYQAVGTASRVSVFDKPCYHYMQRANSIMGDGYSMKRLDAIEGKCQRQQYLECHAPELVDLGLIDLHFSCFYNGQQALKHLPTLEVESTFSVLRNVLAVYPMTARARNQQKLTRKVWLYLENISLKLVCVFRNLIRIGL